MVKKTKGQTLAEDILSNPKSLPEKDPKLLEKAAEFCEGYKAFTGRAPSSTRSTAERPS